LSERHDVRVGGQVALEPIQGLGLALQHPRPGRVLAKLDRAPIVEEAVPRGPHLPEAARPDQGLQVPLGVAVG